jgi:hypothetical protein
LLARAGYSVQEGLDVWKRIQRKSKTFNDFKFVWSDHHPFSAKRSEHISVLLISKTRFDFSFCFSHLNESF